MAELGDKYLDILTQYRVQEAVANEQDRIFKLLTKFADSEGYVNMKVSDYEALIKGDRKNGVS